jgi:glycosyltransferase involved in cell wall biosynthesis
LAGHFKEVIHLAVLHPGNAPPSTAPYGAENVRFEYIPPFGGKGVLNKLRIMWVLPIVWVKMWRLLKQSDIFQFRAPTSIGLFVIPILTIFYPNKKGWYKYAGNWNNNKAPKSYRLQKWMLEKWQKRPVTINGSWPYQPLHIKSFENPCLSLDELPIFRKWGESKKFSKPYTACFVGRLEEAKGVDKIIDLLNTNGIERIMARFHFVGDGEKMEDYKASAASSPVEIVFHGSLDRSKTFSVYAQCHMLVLPSNSEGFPKVIAEAAATGCVPVVSNVGSIGQYINSQNGCLVEMENGSFQHNFTELDFSSGAMLAKSRESLALARFFTFEHFWEKLKSEVFHEL